MLIYDNFFFGRTYNIALELYSAIPDCLDEAIRLGRDIRLSAGQELSTKFVVIVYEAQGRVKGFDQEYRVLSGD